MPPQTPTAPVPCLGSPYPPCAYLAGSRQPGTRLACASMCLAWTADREQSCILDDPIRVAGIEELLTA